MSGYKLVDFSDTLDLSEFYTEMGHRGFENNSSQHKLVDCFVGLDPKAWILYKDNTACGSVVCHRLPELGENSYRICARTASFSEYMPNIGLLTKKRMVHQLQHITTQYYIPAQISYLGASSDMYISSNDSPVASQRLVHNMWCPEMERIGLLTKVKDILYRGHVQTFWKLNTELFLSELNKYPRW